MSTLTIGTRGSALARAQTRWVEAQILAAFPGTNIQTQVIMTSADRDTVTSIRSGSDTGVFVREIEEALLSGHIDLAVHSMKDLPTRIPEGLEIGAIPAREDARDALIAGPSCGALADLPRGAVLGTGSVRRQAQILAHRPDLIARDIRGNVQTRLKKLTSGDYDAIILACAGLNRLGLADRISARFEFSEMLPAPGQGALALEVRKGDHPVAALIAKLHDPTVASAVLAERAFLRRMGGGCNSPIAVHARTAGDSCIVEGLVASPDGVTIIRDEVRAAAADIVAAADALAEKILATGGSAILDSLRRS
jgi:hydroxymethylbilane synthase